MGYFIDHFDAVIDTFLIAFTDFFFDPSEYIPAIHLLNVKFYLIPPPLTYAKLIHSSRKNCINVYLFKYMSLPLAYLTITLLFITLKKGGLIKAALVR